MHTFTDIIRFAISMLSIVNPLGAVPIFIGFCQTRNRRSAENISTSAAVTASLTLLISLFFGQLIIRFFGISIASFTIGGGILLLITALGMISSTGDAGATISDGSNHGCEKEMGMIPLAIPLLSGPGAISISIIATKNFGSTMHWVGAAMVILLLGLLIKIVLRFSQDIGGRMGGVGIKLMTKIMGLILLATSIEMLAGGIKEMLPALRGGMGLISG